MRRVQVWKRQHKFLHQGVCHLTRMVLLENISIYTQNSLKVYYCCPIIHGSGINEPRCEKTSRWVFATRSDTNWAVQLQNMTRGLKFRIKEEEGLYNPYSKNKGTDQLRSYSPADLHLCFRKCKPEDQWSCKRSPDIWSYCKY